MQTYLQNFTQKIGFPPEATDYFCQLYGKVAANKQALDDLEYAKKRLMTGRVMNNLLKLLADLNTPIARLAEFLQVHRFTADMLVLLAATLPAWEKHAFLGFDEQFFLENMGDLTCSLRECKAVHKIWGTHGLDWFCDRFSMNIITFGRFQYERKLFSKPTYTFGNYTVKNGTWVFNTHIPSSGPMTYEARMDSYKRLYAYVAPKDGILPITCTSWLLCPNLLEICDPKSNMIGFLTDFDIIDRTLPTPEQPFSNAWRVFDADYNGDPATLPRNTDLQRRIADWLAAGKGIGSGTGILLFDGEKIINKKEYFTR